MERSVATRPAALLVALFCYALAFQGTRGLWEPDEGRYTAVALEMERSSDYLLPHLNHDTLHLTKPPLTYWLIVGSMRVFGQNEWAVRLPNALAFMATVILVGGMSRRLASGAVLPAPLVYALSLFPFTAANIVSTDTLLTLWETLAVYGFVELQWGPADGERRNRLLLWAALGLAFLTKGPPGLIPLVPIAIFTASSSGWRGARRLISLPSLLVFATIALTWFVVVVATTPGAFAYLVGREVVDRLFTDTLDRNSGWLGLFEAYLPVVLFGGLPWVRELWSGARGAPRWFRPSWWRERRAEDPEGYFLSLWLAAPLVIFLLSRSRMPLYLLPLAVPASLLIARQATVAAASRRRATAMAVWIAVMVLGRGALAFVETSKDSRALAKAILASAPAKPDQALFVETWPRYGVSLYLDAEVEQVRMYPPPPATAGAPLDTVAEELSKGDRVRVFVVSSEDLEPYRFTMSDLGLEVEERGGWRRLSFFWTTDAATPGPAGSEADLPPDGASSHSHE